MSLARLITSLSATADRLITKMGTDSVFVLRASKTSNDKGGKRKTYWPTTVAALPCFYSLVSQSGDQLEQIRATKRRPVVFLRFVVRSDVDVTVSDRLRLMSNGIVEEKELEIVRVADPIGVTREIIAVEEVPE